MRRRAGFTAIELLVVMSVIALLLVITFPVYSSIRRSQKLKRTRAVVETLASAAAAYQNDYGIYPPSEFADAGPNRGNRSLVTLLNAKGGRSAPYLPSAFYDDRGEVEGPLFLDEWDRPFIYFDTSVMKDETSHDYSILGTPAVKPAKGPEGFYNFGRVQIWSCGPNERNDGGLDLHTKEADDLANFTIESSGG